VFLVPVPMRLPKLLLPLAALLVLAGAAPAAAQDVPSKRVLYDDGPTNRYLMDGRWLLRVDQGNQGLAQGFHKQTTTDGWSPTEVPSSWNGRETSNEAMKGGVAWYRKDFRLPSARARHDWVVRFESVSYRGRYWMNGRLVGTSRGAHLPVELRIPRTALRRGGVNRLVVRTENVRKRSDLPPSGQTRTAVPTGGWWNYGGLLREVYLKRVDRVDFNTVQVLPDLPCRTCAATVRFRVTVRNFADSAQRVALSGRFGGQTVRFQRASVGGKRFGTFTARVRVGSPRLWSPRNPRLYNVRLNLRAGDRTVSSYRLRSGIRSVRVVNGKLTLNGLPVNLRGFGVHEDEPVKGFALDNAARDRMIADAREAGASMLRSHYPLHPYTHERADELGMLIWSEIPMYAIKTEFLKSEIVRKTGANELRDNILANGTHPSIITWSLGNELSARPGPVQGDYLRRAARQAKALDPTRPVSYAVAGYPAAGCQTEYAPIDILGINEYFGWYPGPNGQIADRTILSEYLDGVRACYPDKALMITEFGAEANRNGPVEEKGTFEHQQDFVNYHLGVHATKPWLSGSLYWTLREFKIRPEWDGGNPRPSPEPLHQKGVIAYDGTRKPAFADVQRLFRAVDQFPGDAPAP